MVESSAALWNLQMGQKCVRGKALMTNQQKERWKLGQDERGMEEEVGQTTVSNEQRKNSGRGRTEAPYLKKRRLTSVICFKLGCCNLKDFKCPLKGR